MKKCEGHINWLTCEKMKDYRFKQEFCCLANHTGKSLYATGRNVSKYKFDSSTNRFKMYTLFVPAIT